MSRCCTIFLAFLIIACEPAWEEPYKKYTINKGDHAASFKISSLQSELLMFNAIFDSSAIYTSRFPINQHDINKLIGFSDCNSMHHDNSARFGWRWLHDQLEIHAYCYINGTRVSKLIGSVSLGVASNYSLRVTNDHYIFHLDQYEPVIFERGNVCNTGVYYMSVSYTHLTLPTKRIV